VFRWWENGICDFVIKCFYVWRMWKVLILLSLIDGHAFDIVFDSEKIWALIKKELHFFEVEKYLKSLISSILKSG
jgi:hypothetical protein